MKARVTKVARGSARCSKSLARRRFGPNQEKVRSTIQRRGRTTKPFVSSLRFRRGAGSSANPLAQGHVQLGPDRVPDTIALKLAKDVADRRARRKAVARQIARGAPSAQQIEKGVHRCPHVSLARSLARRRLRDRRCQPRPLRIPQITWITLALSPIKSTVLLRPHRSSPLRWVLQPPNHATRRDPTNFWVKL